MQRLNNRGSGISALKGLIRVQSKEQAINHLNAGTVKCVQLGLPFNVDCDFSLQYDVHFD